MSGRLASTEEATRSDGTLDVARLAALGSHLEREHAFEPGGARADAAQDRQRRVELLERSAPLAGIDQHTAPLVQALRLFEDDAVALEDLQCLRELRLCLR